MRFANTMDAFVEPGFVRHYLIDFAASLGSGTIRPHNPREGAEYNLDFWPIMARMFTLGFYRQGWEREPHGVIDPSIGWMQVETFDPAGWKANWPNEAFVNMTVRDGYWGAKLVGSFTDAQVAAAVRAGQLPNEFAADTLTAMLNYRRDRIVEYWYARVTPVENLEVLADDGLGAGFQLAFDDYGIKDGAWSADEISYGWKLRHGALDRQWEGVSNARAGARQVLAVEPSPSDENVEVGGLGATDGSLATLEIAVSGRENFEGRSAIVYLRWDASSGRYSVAGLEH